MLTKLYSVSASAWIILLSLALLAAVSAAARSTGFISSELFMYAVQPVAALLISFAAFLTAHKKRPVSRRVGGRAFLVSSIVAMWFVLYFLSGLISTYVQNTLFTDAKGMALNLWQFGITAAAIEYSRYSLLKLISRRNMLWFGFILSCVLAVQQISFEQLQQTDTLAAFIQLCISDFLPAICASFTLTYLAITCGLAATLMYRLGLVAIFILPPIVPKYDWYMQGISLMLLAVIIYVVMDRNNRADVQHPHRQRNPSKIFEILWITGIIALVCFMTGIFNYQPYAIPTNSMAPVYRRGSMVVVQEIRNHLDIKVGDIVQYKTTSKLVTHRVLAINTAADGSGNKVYIVKGDNNTAVDAPVAHNQVIGVVRTQIPLLGYPTVWLAETTRGKD